MATVRITRPYTMPKNEVREAVEGLAKTLEQEHGVEAHWEGDCVCINRRGMDGKLSFDNGVIDVSVKLGMMASMFEPLLTKEVNRYLDKHVS